MKADVGRFLRERGGTAARPNARRNERHASNASFSADFPPFAVPRSFDRRNSANGDLSLLAAETKNRVPEEHARRGARHAGGGERTVRRRLNPGKEKRSRAVRGRSAGFRMTEVQTMEIGQQNSVHTLSSDENNGTKGRGLRRLLLFSGESPRTRPGPLSFKSGPRGGASSANDSPACLPLRDYSENWDSAERQDGLRSPAPEGRSASARFRGSGDPNRVRRFARGGRAAVRTSPNSIYFSLVRFGIIRDPAGSLLRVGRPHACRAVSL